MFYKFKVNCKFINVLSKIVKCKNIVHSFKLKTVSLKHLRLNLYLNQ